MNVCIGHIQKHIASQLHRLKIAYKGKKLSDGKRVSGIKRLTDNLIAKLDSYYGICIKQNTSSVEAMRAAVHRLMTTRIMVCVHQG